MSYHCKICVDSFKTKQQHQRHLSSNKHKLRASRSSIQKFFECSGCKKKYSHASTLSHHKSKCTVVAETASLQEQMIQMREEFEKEKEEMKAQISLLLDNQKQTPAQTPAQTNNNTTNNHNSHNNNKTQNNVTIQINAVGYENLDHITDQIIIESVGKVFSSIPNILKHIHYDPEHPENLNIQIPNKKQPYARIFKKKSGKWETVHRDEAIDDMVDRGYGFLDDNYPNVKDQISEYTQKHFKRFQDNFEADPNVKKIIKKDVDIMVMNATRE